MPIRLAITAGAPRTTAWSRFRRLLAALVLVAGSAASALAAGAPAGAALAGAVQSGAGDCIAHVPTTHWGYQIGYTAG